MSLLKPSYITFIMEVFLLTSVPMARYIATGDTDGDVGLWEVSSGENIYYKNTWGRRFRGVAFSPDGTQLVG